MADNKKLTILFKSLNECSTIESIEAILRDFFNKNIEIIIYDNNLSNIEISDYNRLSDGELITDEKTVTVPLIIKSHLTGKIIAPLDSDRETLELAAPVVALKIDHLNLSGRIQTNIEFHNAMKNIATIIETQYELNYIIPIIGEVLDTFIANHLIYLFLKHNGKNKLAYPKACLDKTILENVDHITTEYELTQNKKTGYFPLISENNTIGCLVTKSTEGEITPQEIYYMQQLAKQSASTITRANIYADILKHATLDALTGFYNRRQLDERIKQETAETKRKHTPLCAIMTDIDFFKKVNDTYGHAAGDIVLKNVAKIMRSQLREYDIAGRYGGEEFVILLPYTKLDEAVVVAERLRRAVEKKSIDIEKVNTKNNTKNISVTISLGVYEYKPADNTEDLLLNADKALYKAKETGRNRVVIL